MRNHIGMEYYSNGNRSGMIPERRLLENKAIKVNKTVYILSQRTVLIV